jgi:hypothetical protein
MRLTFSRLADGYSHSCHLVQPRPIPLHRKVLEQLTPEFRLARCFVVHPCLLTVRNYITHSHYNLSRMHRLVQSVLIYTTHPPVNGTSSRMATVVGAHHSC